MAKKCYISAKSLKKEQYKKMLSAKYELVFGDDLTTCEILLAPSEADGLSDEQRIDIDTAHALGIDVRVFDSILSEENMDASEKEARREHMADLDLEMEI